MTKTQVSKRKRVTIKLNPLIVDKMVQDITNKMHGRRYCFDDTALNSLQETAERFLEKMWEQLRQLSHNNVVTIQHIHLWKRKTGFEPRFKANDLSLCKIFNQ